MELRPVGPLGDVSRFLRVVMRHPGVDSRLAALGRFVVRQTHKRVVGGALMVRWEGMQLAVAPDSPSAAAAYYFGRPDWWEFDFLERFLRPGDVALDVGANVGVYALFMAKLVGPRGRVLACEPDPANAAALRANLSRNGFAHVRIVDAAVGEHEGSVGFVAGQRTQSRIARGGEATNAVAALTTVDALCAGAEPVFAKIDVEGAEDAVLRGARALMRRGAPAVWQLEVDPQRRQQHARLAAVLEEFGYRSFVWDPAAATLRACALDHPPGNNVLAIADRDGVEARLQPRRRPAAPGGAFGKTNGSEGDSA